MSLKQVAIEVLTLVDNGCYEFEGRNVEFSSEQRLAAEGTRVYSPAELERLRSRAGDAIEPIVEVVNATTQEAAHSASMQGPVGLLNFASARNPGGGFLNGAKAQEEDLCRCSGLYRCIEPCHAYYKANRRQESLLYTDYAIYSPRVPFFKVRGSKALLSEPYYASVITAPAPNTGPFLQRNPGREQDLEVTFERRWSNVFAIARDQSVSTLILGAWGCGAFGGDPEMAARTAQQALKHGGVRQVIFAIPNKGNRSAANYEAFQKLLTP